MADTFSITTINGKKCTAVPRANNAVGGQATASTSVAATSTSISSSSTSTSTSFSTSSSSSSSSSTSTSISLSTSVAAAPVAPTDVATTVPPPPPPAPVVNPALSEATSSVTQETTTSTTSSTSLQDVVSSVASPTQAFQNPAIINAPFPVPATSSSSSTTSIPTSTSTSTPTPTPTTSPDVLPSPDTTSTSTSIPTSPSSPTIDGVLQSTETSSPTSFASESEASSETTGVLATATQTDNIIASTLTSDAQSGASTQSRESTEAGAAATTATAATATTATTSNGTPLESQATGAGLPDSSQKAATGMGISNETTIAIASGVVGGIVVISLIAFLIWFWRKRTMKKRRSTLLTPLTAEPPYGSKEKDEQYIISRTSLGPTPLPQKLRAMVSYNYERLRGRVNGFVDRSPSPSVNLNRGNSQFGPLDAPESRSASRNENPKDAPHTAKDRFVDWWGRLTEDANMKWRLKSEPKSNRNDNDPFAATRSMKEGKPTRIGSQPDFLTLLSQDEATREGGPSGASSDPSRRRSVSVGNEHFLGGLGLSFDNVDPFSDSNAIPRNSAKVAPLAVSAANNPFSDANAIAGPAAVAARISNGPTTYVQNIRHSRGHSVSAAGAGSRGPPPRVSVTSNRSSGAIYYRESGASVESFETRRNKFRSDPFDLDRPELLRGGPAGTAAIISRNASAASKKSRRGSRGFVEDAAGPGPGPQAPSKTHVRAESYSSRYSSGVSSIGDDWSDPGPDVGPGSGKWDGSGSGGNGNTTRTRSGGSQGSVGKAL